MLKNILNVNGVKRLNKDEQESLNGGFGPGFCYLRDRNTCCCFFDDVYPNGDFICARGESDGFGRCRYV